MPYRPATVAFPVCWFSNVATKHNAPLWTIRDRICHANGNLARLSTHWTDGKDGLKAAINLAGIAGIQDAITARRPAQDMTRRGLEGKALSRATGCRHNIDLARTLFATHECQLFAIG